MKDVIYNFINEHMMIHIVLIALCIAATIGAMFVDLVSGIMKAKQRGEARTSTGYKKTAIKAKKYFTPFIELCFIDLLCCVVIPFPVFSMIWTGYCIFCEFKSVREKSWEKAELRKAEKTMSVIIENKDDIAKIMAQILFDEGQGAISRNNEKPASPAALTALVDNVLDPLRTWWGKPITVNSGYRCPELNAAVRGSKTSQHMKGEAADIDTGDRQQNKLLFEYIRRNLPYDQLIDESNFAWVHVSYRADGNNRMQVLKL